MSERGFELIPEEVINSQFTVDSCRTETSFIPSMLTTYLLNDTKIISKKPLNEDSLWLEYSISLVLNYTNCKECNLFNKSFLGIKNHTILSIVKYPCTQNHLKSEKYES